MSHIVTIRTQIRDPAGIALACERLQLPPPGQGTFDLFSSQATGWCVQLPGWQYAVVFQTDSGEAKLDNYGGRWGDQKELDRFLQAYAAERAKIEARKKGYSVTEQSLQDGSIKLTIQVAGGAA